MGIFLDGPVVQGIKVGDIIKATRTQEYEDGQRPHTVLAEYKVIHVSKHTVTAVRNKGRDKRVFSYGDLVMNGLQPQYRCSEEAFIRNPRPEGHRKTKRNGGKQHAGSV